MKYINIILTLLLLLGCSNKLPPKLKTEKIEFGYGLGGMNELELKLTMQVPEESSFEKYGHEAEYTYYYTVDSVIIYVTNSKYPLNDERIKLIGDTMYKWREQNSSHARVGMRVLFGQKATPLPDTLEYSGVDKDDSLYWKDILLDNIGISVGYCKVPKEKKHFFDSLLTTLKIDTLYFIDY
ncbi:MAG: hypothetical protein LBL74_01600 [Bacteroidales bacterium]|jgi:hypothetical protein|nr:hypothetical protein [Bacteroidales bacterium]